MCSARIAGLAAAILLAGCGGSGPDAAWPGEPERVIGDGYTVPLPDRIWEPIGQGEYPAFGAFNAGMVYPGTADNPAPRGAIFVRTIEPLPADEVDDAAACERNIPALQKHSQLRGPSSAALRRGPTGLTCSVEVSNDKMATRYVLIRGPVRSWMLECQRLKAAVRLEPACDIVLAGWVFDEVQAPLVTEPAPLVTEPAPQLPPPVLPPPVLPAPTL